MNNQEGFRKSYKVSGMHCAACEHIVLNIIKDVKGVKNVKVSSKNGSLEFEEEGSNKLDLDLVNEHLADYGYFVSKKEEAVSFSLESYMTAFVVGVVLFVTYIVLDEFGLFNIFAFPELKTGALSFGSIFSFFTFGVLASITSCAALVGGIITALSRNWSRESQTISIVKFHIGRVFSFALFGSLLGFLSAMFQFSVFVFSIVTIAISVVMIVIGLQILRVPYVRSFTFSAISLLIPKVLKTKNNQPYSPFVFGGATFFIPCGFTLIAQSLSVMTGDPAVSGILMFSFALGTLPALILYSVSGYMMGKKSDLSDAFSILASLGILIYSLYTINSQFNVLGLPSFNNFLIDNRRDVMGLSLSSTSTLKQTENGQIQQVKILARDFEYYPPFLKLKADLPTELNIISKDVVGCARVMWLGGLYDKPIYLEGTGEQNINFIPKKGRYKISCTMGMVSPIEVVVE
jgi:sulfite exporter TauE/SafE/copper chaperone CopZ